MKLRTIALLVISLFLAVNCFAMAQTAPDVWERLIIVKRYAATVRAIYARDCNANTPIAQTPPYKLLCPKLASIPNNVIESAAIPYMRAHISREVAEEAVTFWTSVRGQELSKKIAKEVDSGIFDQLTSDDLCLLDEANKSRYGLALSAFATDREAASAVARAMVGYEP